MKSEVPEAVALADASGYYILQIEEPRVAQVACNLGFKEALLFAKLTSLLLTPVGVGLVVKAGYWR